MGKDYYDPDRVIARRNERLERFFELLYEGTEVHFRLIGDKNCPAIIIDESFCLSCFVKNFDLHFTDKPNQGEILESVKLQKDQQIDRDKIVGILEKVEHRKIFKVRHKGTLLYLAGYNFTDKKKLDGKYPVFAKYNPKIYFSKEYAVDIIESYKDYDLEIE